jgi:large exoprotein involved in heme utilization and adhesion
MRNVSTKLGIAAIALGMSASAALAAENLGGRWAATTVQGGVTVPFRLDISGEGTTVVGTLFNGEDKQFTTSGTIKDGKVELNFDHYLVSILATCEGWRTGRPDRIATRRSGGGNRHGTRPWEQYISCQAIRRAHSGRSGERTLH